MLDERDESYIRSRIDDGRGQMWLEGGCSSALKAWLWYEFLDKIRDDYKDFLYFTLSISFISIFNRKMGSK